jgi:hypothetical protein
MTLHRALHPVLFSRFGRSPFNGGDFAFPDVVSFARFLTRYAPTFAPVLGGALTLNGGSLGSYGVRISEGDATVSSFVSSDWFTATDDSESAWVVHKGNLVIPSGQTFRPSARKLFTVVYVTGNLVISGEISMSQRGANHSAAGSNITATAISIATGTFSGVTDPQVPAAGGGGGSGRSVTQGNLAGGDGTGGTNGATGGGGGGGAGDTNSGGSSNSSAGRAGTSFSGGPGGGGAGAQGSNIATAGAGTDNGGVGGAGGANGGNSRAGGGAGNPGGSGAGGSGGNSGSDGTGGVLVILVGGDLSGAGSITAAGANGGAATASSSSGGAGGGGGSGGGSVTVMVGGSDTGPTPTALGGTGGTASAGGQNGNGGNGGSGTARKLVLA